MHAEGVQFYYPTNTNPGIVLLVLYSIALRAQSRTSIVVRLDIKNLFFEQLNSYKSFL